MEKINKAEVHRVFQNIKLGKPNAKDELYVKYHKLVTNISFSIVKNNDVAEDISQSVFLKILQIPSQKLPDNHELSWLYTVTKNQTIDYLRSKRTNLDLEDLYDIPNEKNDINNVIDMDSYNKIVDSLNVDEKEIVSLKVLTNYTFREIGLILDMPTGTVQWKYYKSVHTLKILLSNLSLFIITTLAYVMSTNKYSQNINRADSEYSIDESITAPLNNISPADVSQSAEHGTSSLIGINTFHIDKEHVLLGFSGIFLIFTIVFAIIYAKHRIKRHKKISATS